jgi:hypothetical protein
MKAAQWGSKLGICMAAGLLTACAGSELPISAPGAPPQTRAVAAPDAKSGDLLYAVSDSSWVYVMTYPERKEIGSVPLGVYYVASDACADASGNVWVTGGYLIEFKRGSIKPLVKRSAEHPLQGCSVDATTGNIAAVSRGGNEVYVWPARGGSPTVYRAKWDYALRYCGYDAHGDLFVNGVEEFRSPSFVFLELQKSSDKLQRLTFDAKVNSPGQVQWDGKYITIQDAEYGDIYQLKISNSEASVVNTVHFNGLGEYPGPSWIQGDTVLIPHKILGVYRYPAGGNPIKTFKGRPLNWLTTVALSVARHGAP